MKRFTCLGLIITLVLLLPVFATAQQSEQDFIFQVGEDGNVTITAYVGAEADVIIPVQLAGGTVTSIGFDAFSDNSNLRSVVVPEGVVSIGRAAFQNCLNLVKVDLPSSLTEIGVKAFNSCGKLESIVIPDRVTVIAESTFFRCLQLREVTLPKGLKSIGEMAFAVTGLEKLELPFSLESIGRQAFYGNRNLVSVALPNSITVIEPYAFFVCENLKSIVMPASLPMMASGLFDKCPNLEMIAIPMSVRQIKDDALYDGIMKPAFVKIHGAKGSEAENFARRVGLPFEPVAAAEIVRIMLNEQDIMGKKLAIDLSSVDKSIQLQATVTPNTLWPGVKWESSSAKIAAVDPYGLVTGFTKGEVTIAASAVDGSGVQASFQLNVANLAKSISIEGQSSIPAKGKTALRAVVLPAATDNKGVEWSVSDSSVASINASGVVTASDVSQRKHFTITAAAKDGSGVIGTYELTVNPLVSQISLLFNGEALEDKSALSLDLASDKDAIQLVAKVLPEDAIQAVSWKSSSPKVAAVSEDGLVTGLKKGKTTISATSTDGTQKTVSCNISFANLAKEINITGENAVTAGSSIKLEATVLPETTDNKKVTWTSSNEDAARVSKAGVVTARKVKEKQEVTITAVSQDGSEAIALHLVSVHPEAIEVSLSMNGQTLEPKAALSIDLSLGETSIQLSADVAPVDALQQVVWKSSDPRVAAVDENGMVTGLKKGKATITATTADGAKMRASCIVTVSNPAK